MKIRFVPLALSVVGLSALALAASTFDRSGADIIPFDKSASAQQPRAQQSDVPQLNVVPAKKSAVYAPGEPIIWKIEVSSAAATAIDSVHYTIKKDGQTVISEGALPLQNGAAQLQTKLDAPGSIIGDFSFDDANKKAVKIAVGALVKPFSIEPSRPEPDDFMEFWQSKIAELKSVPINPVLTAQKVGKPNVDYYQVTLDSVDSHVQGQLARPSAGEKFPALVRFQYAGVYGLGKGNVTDNASNGWLTLNISAHDLPLDESKEFYAAQNKGPLKDYFKIGAQSRETSYFLNMALRCYRAIDYLQTRPDWDGKTLVVEGTSQGGLQSLMMGGLNPAVTAVIVNVPAGNDTTAPLAGRAAPWPYWANMDGDKAQILETSRYFDGVNFARHIKVPTLMSVGFVDTVARPFSILAAFNQLQSPTKKLVMMPMSDHQGRGGTQAAYYKNLRAWLDALSKGEAPPTS